MVRASNLYADLRNRRKEEAERKMRQQHFASLAAGAMPFLTPIGGLALGMAAGWRSAGYYKKMLEAEAYLPIHPAYRWQVPETFSHNPNLYLGHGVDFQDYRHLSDKALSLRGVNDADSKQLVRDAIMRKAEPIFLTDDMATRHMFVAGSTGTGKSVMCKSLAFQQIARGGSLVVFDAKGSSEMMADLYQIARIFNREHDLRFFDLNKPRISHSYNPILKGNVRESVATLMKLYGEEKAGSEFFRAASKEGLLAGFLILRNLADSAGVTFADLTNLFSSPQQMHDMIEGMPDGHDKQYVWQFMRSWIIGEGKDVRLNTQRYGEVLSGLRTKCADFAHSEWINLVNVYDPEIELQDCLLNGKIVVISIPAMADAETAKTFGRLFMADLSRAVGVMAANNQKPLVPAMVLLDEYANIADPSQLTLFAQARSQNVSLAVTAQGASFMESVGQYFNEQALANMWTHLYFNVRDPRTKELAIKGAGTAISRFANDGKSQNFGTSYENYETGLLNTENQGEGVSVGFREMREDMVRPEDFDLDKGELLMFGAHGAYRMMGPILEFDEATPDINTVDIPRPERHGERRKTLLEKSYEATAVIEQAELRAARVKAASGDNARRKQ